MDRLKIEITKTTKSRLSEYDINSAPFGKIFADHMFIAEYNNGVWEKAYVIPYGDLPLSYGMSALHYGQSIFEGMKAYKMEDGSVAMFRPEENFKRLNKSAIRMAMPEVPEYLFMEGLTELLKLDKEWVPTDEFGSLYLRPFLISTDVAIGVKPSESYKFIIFNCPAGKYYSAPVKVLIETDYFRAVKGGVGYVKASGNYGRSLYPTKLAQQKGYDQVIWTDSVHHRFVEESGTMNLMFVLDGKLVTPAVSDTILNGITRDTVLKVARDWGMTVEERPISIEELFEAHAAGKLEEAFGTGTAATIAHISLIGFKDKQYELPAVENRKFSPKVDEYLRNLRKGKVEDKFHWMHKIN